MCFSCAPLTIHTQVDVIISSSVGHNLFIGHGLDEMVDARDKWLKADGLMLPDRITFHLAAMRFKQSDFWHNVYGFRMDCMNAYSDSEPFLDRVSHRHQITKPSTVADLNLYAVQKPELTEFATCFRLQCTQTATIEALFTYFTVNFTSCVQPLQFSSSSSSHETYWKPMVYPLKRLSSVRVKANDAIYGIFRMAKESPETHKIDWHIEYCVDVEQTSLRESLHFVSA